jgi:2-hydroxy-3-keto-5-methylthiopentenyl-1-phosphate phosphatase
MMAQMGHANNEQIHDDQQHKIINQKQSTIL